jgi:prepilin-type N-terminal cleavage/methylation domain-containing protein
VKRLRRSGADTGVSLVEMLVVLVLLSVVGAITTTGMIKATQSARQTQDRAEALADVEKGLQRMSREIRAAHPINIGAVRHAPIASASADAVQVRILRKNLAGVDRSYAFTYRYTAGQVLETRREAAPGADPAVGTVSYGPDGRFLTRVVNTAPVFLYYDANGALLPLTATCGAVACLAEDSLRRVAKVRISISRSVPEKSVPLTVSTLVSLRNNVR